MCELYTSQTKLSTILGPVEFSLVDHAGVLLLVQQRDHAFQLRLFPAQFIGQLSDFPVQPHVFGLKRRGDFLAHWLWLALGCLALMIFSSSWAASRYDTAQSLWNVSLRAASGLVYTPMTMAMSASDVMSYWRM